MYTCNINCWQLKCRQSRSRIDMNRIFLTNSNIFFPRSAYTFVRSNSKNPAIPYPRQGKDLCSVVSFSPDGWKRQKSKVDQIIFGLWTIISYQHFRLILICTVECFIQSVTALSLFVFTRYSSSKTEAKPLILEFIFETCQLPNKVVPGSWMFIISR